MVIPVKPECYRKQRGCKSGYWEKGQLSVVSQNVTERKEFSGSAPEKLAGPREGWAALP
jgi:hypothetical protein